MSYKYLLKGAKNTSLIDRLPYLKTWLSLYISGLVSIYPNSPILDI